MKRYRILLAIIAVGLLMAHDVHAQRRGGGGRSFGGGGRGGGQSFSGGGRSMSSSGNRGSMGGFSRSGSSSYSRPGSSNSSRANTSNFNRSNANRPSSSSFNRGNLNSANSGNANRNSFNRGNSSGRTNTANRSNFNNNAFNRSGSNTRNQLGSSSGSRAGLNSNNSLRSRPSTSQFQGASRNQVSDFLGLSDSGSRGSGSRDSRSANSASRTASNQSLSENRGSRGTPNESGGRTFEGENFTIDTVKGGGSGTTEGGAKYGGAGAGMVITDSEGNQRFVGKGVGGATDGTNSVAGKGSVRGGSNVDGSAGAVRSGQRVATDGNTVARSGGVAGAGRDSQGNVRGGAAGGRIATDGTNTVGSAGAVRGGVNADGSGGVAARGGRFATDGENAVVQRGAAGAVQDRYGNVRGGVAGGTRYTDGTNVWSQGGAARFAVAPNGAAVARGVYGTGYNGIVTSRGQVAAVRTSWGGYGRYYGPRWYAQYPGAWFAAGVAAASWWSAPSYGYVSGYCGYAEEPVTYNYGDEGIYVDEGNVYLGDEVIASEEEYYNQATAIADAYQEPAEQESEDDEGDWLPLGVFAVVSAGQEKSDVSIQLALNQEGTIRGNLFMELTDTVVQVTGSVDKETQRAAFRLVDKPEIVVECGLFNLTEDTLTVLVHKGQGAQEERGLIRLTQDEEQMNKSDQESSADAASTPQPGK